MESLELSSEKMRNGFFLFQIFLIVAAFFVWRMLRSDSGKSQFKLRESERLKANPLSPKTGESLADAKVQKKSPLLLAGLSLEGTPSEILGVKENASKDEINKAFRELMKRYHPDKIGRQGSREWQDAQKIAEKINEARNVLLSKAKH